MGRFWSAVIAVGTLLLIAAVVIGLLQTGTPSSASGGDHHKSTSTTTTTVAGKKHGLTAEQIAELTIKTSGINCAQLAAQNGATLVQVGGNQLFQSIVASVSEGVTPSGPRATSDAIEVPFSSTTQFATDLNEAQTHICVNPQFGADVAYGFCQLTIGGQTVESMDVWLQPFCVSNPSELNAIVQDRVVLPGVTPTSAQQQDIIDYQKSNGVAEYLGTLLMKFALLGTSSKTATGTLHIVDATVGKVPSMGVDPNPDSKPALDFQFSEKNGCSLAEFGLNLQDERFELFPLPTCQAPPAPQPAPKPVPMPKPVKTPPHHGTTTTTAPPKHGTTTTAVPMTTTSTSTPTTSTTPPTTVTTTTKPPCRCITPTTVSAPPTTVPSPITTTTLPGATSPPGGFTGTTTPSTTSPPGTLPPTTTPGSGVTAH